MAGAHVVIADDEHAARSALADQVAALGHRAHPVPSGEEALRLLEEGTGDVLLLDLVMPDLDGFAVLEAMHRRRLSIPALAVTREAEAEGAAAAVHAGAVDFVLKPVCSARLKVAIGNALRLSALEAEVDRLGRRERRAAPDLGTATRSPTMRRTLRALFRPDRRNFPVLLEGEAGTGKETLARALHASDRRRTGPFVTLQDGRPVDEACRDAASGTLFVPTIENLSETRQVALSDRLEDTRPAGKGALGFRLIATAHTRLVDRVAEGRFSNRLYNRLNVMPIWIPPLRDRPEDLPILCRALLARQASGKGGVRVRHISNEALSRLAAHDWRGNLWELESVMGRALATCTSAELGVRDVDTLLCPNGHSGAENAALEPIGPVGHRPIDRTRQLYGVARMLGEKGQLRTMNALEKDLIGFALDHCQGRVSEVARGLGIGRSTLYRKIKEYELAARSAE